jgi:hypothetical protein
MVSDFFAFSNAQQSASENAKKSDTIEDAEVEILDEDEKK